MVAERQRHRGDDVGSVGKGGSQEDVHIMGIHVHQVGRGLGEEPSLDGHTLALLGYQVGQDRLFNRLEKVGRSAIN